MTTIIVQILPYLLISVLFVPTSVIFHEIGHLVVTYLYSKKYKPVYPLNFKAHLKIWDETLAGVTTVSYKEDINDTTVINYEDFLLENGKITPIIFIYFAGIIFQIISIILLGTITFLFTNAEAEIFLSYSYPIHSTIASTGLPILYTLWTFFLCKRKKTSDFKEILKYLKIKKEQKKAVKELKISFQNNPINISLKKPNPIKRNIDKK